MTNKAMSPNSREALSAQSTIGQANEYLYETGHALNVYMTGGGNSTGTTLINTAQVSLAATSTLIIASNSNRRTITIVNLSGVDIYIGNTGVSTTTGQLLLGTKGTAITISSIAAIYGITSTGTANVSYLEETN